MYIDPASRAKLIDNVRRKAEVSGFDRRPRVFDGDNLAVRPIMEVGSEGSNRFGLIFGEPYDLDDSVTVQVRRSRSNNLLVLGSTNELGEVDASVLGALHTCVAGSALQGATVGVVDLIGDEQGSVSAIGLGDLCTEVGAQFQRGQGALRRILDDVVAEVRTRHASQKYDLVARMAVVHGIQRALDLEAYDPFSVEDDSGPESLAKVLREVLSDGPDVGIHIVVTVDDLGQFERRLGKELLKEFGWRLIASQ